MSRWDERLAQLVVPAIHNGCSIYTGYGELHPSLGPIAQAAGKPIGLPGWQVYKDAVPGVHPVLRTLQVIQKARNLVGKAWQVYPCPRDRELGTPLAIPLGEGLETPESELRIARDFAATILFKPVRVIALMRNRLPQPFVNTNRPVCEPILMEIYTDQGDLLWANPYAEYSLEEAIALIQQGATGASTTDFRPKVIPLQPVGSEPTDSSSVSREDLEAEFQNLRTRGMSDEAVEGHIVEQMGLHPILARRLMEDYTRRTTPDQAVQAQIREAVTQVEKYYSGEEVLSLVSEMTNQSPDVVRRVIQESAIAHQVDGEEFPLLAGMDLAEEPEVPLSKVTEPEAAEDPHEDDGGTLDQVKTHGGASSEKGFHEVPDSDQALEAEEETPTTAEGGPDGQALPIEPSASPARKKVGKSKHPKPNEDFTEIMFSDRPVILRVEGVTENAPQPLLATKPGKKPKRVAISAPCDVQRDEPHLAEQSGVPEILINEQPVVLRVEGILVDAPQPEPIESPDPVPKKVKIEVPWAIQHIKENLNEHAEEYRRMVLEHLGTVAQLQQPCELRMALGIPDGSTKAWKHISDLFRRKILKRLEKEGKIYCEGEGRHAAYGLKNAQ